MHKHKESDIRKRNELQNEAVGVWDEARFQNGGGRNSPAAFAALQMPDTFLPTIFLSRLHLFLRLVNVPLPVLTQKVFFFTCNLKSSQWAGICRRGRDNCEVPRQVSRRKQYSRTAFERYELEYPLASYTAASLGLCLCLCVTRFTAYLATKA